jgi:hypothetical protein
MVSSCVLTKTPYVTLVSLIHATCPNLLIRLKFFIFLVEKLSSLYNVHWFRMWVKMQIKIKSTWRVNCFLNESCLEATLKNHVISIIVCTDFAVLTFVMYFTGRQNGAGRFKCLASLTFYSFINITDKFTPLMTSVNETTD